MKKIIALSALALISLNIYAYEGHGFKIISEHTYISPGSHGGFMPTPSPKLMKPQFSSTWVNAHNASGYPYEYIKVIADHSININNQSSQPQRYKYTYTLRCVDVNEVFEREVEVNPYGTFNDSTTSYGVFQPTTNGTFDIIADTVISGAETSNCRSNAKVYVR